MQVSGCIVAVLALAPAAAGLIECTGQSDYDWPVEGSCWRYWKCEKDSTKPEGGWCLPLIRRFSEKDQRCEWFFQTSCDVNPGPPPTPSVPTTQPPTTQSTTVPTTQPPTTQPPTTQPPTTLPPTTQSPTTQPPTTQPPTTQPPTTQPTTTQPPTTQPPTTQPPTTQPTTSQPATTKKPNSEADTDKTKNPLSSKLVERRFLSSKASQVLRNQ